MEKIDFSKDEKYILHYYQSPSGSRFSRYLFAHLYYLVPSGVFAGIAVYQDSVAWAFTAYGLIAVYTLYQLVQAKRFIGFIPSIIAKYEVRIETLERELGESGRKV